MSCHAVRFVVLLGLIRDAGICRTVYVAAAYMAAAHMAAVHGCTWLYMVVHGSTWLQRTWLQYMAAVYGCSTWLQYMAAVNGCSTWLQYMPYIVHGCMLKETSLRKFLR